MDLKSVAPLSPPTVRAQALHSGCCSLPPANVIGSHHTLPSYPSSMLQYYYPFPHYNANYAHISSSSHPFPSHPSDTVESAHIPLPSASQSHVPSLRHTPSASLDINIDNQRTLPSPFLDQRFHNHSRASECTHSLSPIAFTQPHFDPNAFPSRQFLHPLHAAQPTYPLFPQPFYQHPQPAQLAPVLPVIHNSSSISSLPSTKDVPLLTGKHNWGPWHLAVRTLILNSNLLASAKCGNRYMYL